MTRKTLNFLHASYNEVCKDPSTINIIDVLRKLLVKLSEYKVPPKDSEEFDILYRNIERSIKFREKTFQLTNMVSDVCFTMLYIGIWANAEHNLDIDINILARRKALESELTKFLEKGEVHDRFGIRGIVLNNDSEDDSVEISKLRMFCQYVVNILTSRNRKDLKEFSDWIKASNLDDYTQKRIEYILNLPFKVSIEKDYIAKPKANQYKSLHLVLAIEMYSDILPGAEFELQLRTIQMHRNAVNGSSSHFVYKNRLDATIKDVFKIDDFSEVQIVGLTSYDSTDTDIAGIHHANIFVNRRISNHLVTF